MASIFAVASFTKENREKEHKHEKKRKIREKEHHHVEQANKSIYDVPYQIVNLFGLSLYANKYVRVLVGPVIGKVDSTSANILLEVNGNSFVTVHLVPENSKKAKVVTLEQEMPRNIPHVFVVTGLVPKTTYNVCFSGLNKKNIVENVGKFTTLPKKIKKLGIIALSCDRPERIKDGETNMWKLVEDKLNSNEVQIVLHLGDQVYGQKELTDAFVILRQAQQDGIENDQQLYKVCEKVQQRLADIYRFTWGLGHTAKSLARGSHLMIWSDNDLYNDFTITKDDLAPLQIHLGHMVYRRYQRQLWDPNYKDSESCEEECFQKIGPVGILLLDMRGNRIDFEGRQLLNNPIVSEEQWKLIDQVFSDDSLKVLVVCAEIPFVEDTPERTIASSKKPGLEFLTDHWTANPAELERILKIFFDWKAAGKGEREIVLIGGDIHVGVDTVITDDTTGITIRQLTATPITNHVTEFFPPLENKIFGRFSYKHTAVKVRNFAQIDISVEDNGVKVKSELIRDPNPPGAH
eukprot:TRINITY_DN131_c0_g1_i5.p1 TRINITY_DN131_c0_g1~~TRINITY_DN131_c0_g1_i5.p1  ORF type:complete len:520 (-),score=128.09 TRINITY_DN131_c0_g1_i5:67-1626(-)